MIFAHRTASWALHPSINVTKCLPAYLFIAVACAQLPTSTNSREHDRRKDFRETNRRFVMKKLGFMTREAFARISELQSAEHRLFPGGRREDRVSLKAKNAQHMTQHKREKCTTHHATQAKQTAATREASLVDSPSMRSYLRRQH